MPPLTRRDRAVLSLFAVMTVATIVLALLGLTIWALVGLGLLVGASAMIGHVQFVTRRATYQMLRRASWAGATKPRKSSRAAKTSDDSIDTRKAGSIVAREASRGASAVQGYVENSANSSKPTSNDSDTVKVSYSGRIEESRNSVLRGWAVDDNDPGGIFTVEVLLDGYPYMRTTNSVARRDLRKLGRSRGQGGIHVARSLHDLVADGEDHTLAWRFPDGTTSRKYLLPATARSTHGFDVAMRGVVRHDVTIIVPIYNAPDDLEVCIERLLMFTPDFASIILIDDCSSDSRVREILANYAETPRVSVLYNPKNLGFTRTVNRGIAEAGNDDVLLLNSDARVTPDWLEGMLAAAASAPRIATVTAMSDRAGAFSAPMIGNDNPLPAGVDEISYSRAFRRRAVGAYPRVPTGNGFCMWISRQCIEAIGVLDEESFPRGYGEENDFCMRAGRAGWFHVIDDRTYVFHDRSKSFGDSKSELIAAGRAVVDSRYPEYGQAIRVFRESPEIALARNRAHVALRDVSSEADLLPRVLYVVSTATGGTPQTNADLMRALDDAIEPWILLCNSQVVTLSRYVDGEIIPVRQHELRNVVDPIGHLSQDYDSVVSSWLGEYDFEVVHIRHLLWHSLSLPQIAKQCGAKVVVSFHDYYALSPNLKLIDDRGVYLGDEYRVSGSVYRDSGWGTSQYPMPTADWLRWWRDRFWRSVQMCDAFVTTSASARELILSHFTEMDPERFKVIEHGRDFDRFRTVTSNLRFGEPMRILVPGGLTAAKGAQVLRSIVAADTRQQIEWHILGPTKEKFELGGSRVVYHGAYKRDNFGELVEKIAPHAGAVLSIWDETYCHTLTEMWSVGLPVFVLDFPNVAQRVRRFGAGWVLNGLDGVSLLAQITERLTNRKQRVEVLDNVSDWQHGWGTAWTTKQMALRYLGIYREVCNEFARDARINLRVGVLAPASRDLTGAPASTFIRMWERTKNSMGRGIDYIRVAPDGAISSVRNQLLDVLIVQRTAVPAAAATELLEALETAKVPLIVELDDDLTATHSETEGHQEYLAAAPTLVRLMERATALSVSTEPLRSRFEYLNVRTEVFPAALSDALWRQQASRRTPDGKVRALYFGNRTHGGDLEIALPALDAIALAHPEFELVLAGVASGPQIDELRRDRRWLSNVDVPDQAKQYPQFVEWLRAYSSRCDFAIAPLANSELNAHKSDLKLLEYSGLGLRTVASSVGPYGRTSIPGVTVVENTTDAWLAAIRSTMEDIEVKGSRIDARGWLVENRMLSQQLPRFDAFIGSSHSSV